MNKILCLAAGLLALNLAPVSAQPAPPPQFSPPQVNLQTRLHILNTSADPATQPALTKFSLNFPGGSPSQFVEAIEKATGKPLNVIINKEDEDVVIPPLTMNEVVMPQLFTALEEASRKTVQIKYAIGFNNGYNYTQMGTSYGFKTADSPLSDTSVWYFHVERPAMPPVFPVEKVCQFYSLSDYLNHGFTVDDITTAIQTGWKLSGETNPPELNYHKETKLLIAYGEPEKLKTVDQVLQTLHEEVEQLKNAPPGPGGNFPKAPFPEEKSGK